MKRTIEWLSVLWPWVLAMIAAVGIQIALMFGAGCNVTRQQHASAANAVAVVSTVAIGQLRDIARDRELAIIEAAPDYETAKDAIHEERKRWRPVWAAVDALALAHSQWATAIERGETIDPRATVQAFCNLRKVAPVEIRDPFGFCEVTP